ncbi:MAG: hypothetical protein IKZ28_06975, partial [Clostridia bacterium]|nr:hypothetical protein [Clostridia bacterium]
LTVSPTLNAGTSDFMLSALIASMIPFILDFTSVIYETFITRCVIPHHAQKKAAERSKSAIII